MRHLRTVHSINYKILFFKLHGITLEREGNWRRIRTFNGNIVVTKNKGLGKKEEGPTGTEAAAAAAAAKFSPAFVLSFSHLLLSVLFPFVFSVIPTFSRRIS